MSGGSGNETRGLKQMSPAPAAPASVQRLSDPVRPFAFALISSRRISHRHNSEARRPSVALRLNYMKIGHSHFHSGVARPADWPEAPRPSAKSVRQLPQEHRADPEGGRFRRAP